MRKRLLILASIFCVLPLAAQNMRSVFVTMPDSVAPLLTKINKEDCIDFLDSKMKAEVKNRFGNSAELKVLTDDYLHMQMTAVSTLEMKLLPLNDSVKVVCMVKTVCGPVADSEVHFFTPQWQKLPASTYLEVPSVEKFYLPQDTLASDYPEIRKKADMDLMEASLSKDDASISFQYTTPDYMSKEDREKLLPYLRKEPVVLRWRDGKFGE